MPNAVEAIRPRSRRLHTARNSRQVSQATSSRRSACEAEKKALRPKRERTARGSEERVSNEKSNRFAPGMIMPQRTRLPRAAASG